jgi:hypothetical protein
MLIARIESFEQSYYISENREHRSPVSDEAMLNIAGRIEQISPALKAHLGEPIGITLACARSYSADEPTPEADKPFLLRMNLSKKQRSFMAYLPSDAFWSIPRMIDSGRITHVEADFEPLRHGSSDLKSVYLASKATVAELQENPLTSKPLAGTLE